MNITSSVTRFFLGAFLLLIVGWWVFPSDLDAQQPKVNRALKDSYKTTLVSEVVPGEYIVVLKSQPTKNAPSPIDPKKIAQAYAVTPKFVYTRALAGFSTKLTPEKLAQVKNLLLPGLG